MDEQVEFLNDTVSCKLAPSKIHGIGVHALRDIKKGETLYCRGVKGELWYRLSDDHLKKLNKEVQELILARWPIVKSGGQFLHPHNDAMLISFMNHSDSPNYDKYTDKALCDIIKGTEITEDYEQYKDFL